jgi:tetratricopeptide (TPR) repeat protein
MRRRVPVLALAVNLIALSAAAQEKPETSAAPSQPEDTSGSFGTLWERARAAQEAGDLKQAQDVLDRIQRVRIERNIVRLDTVAMSLVAEGLGKLQAGDKQAAREDFENAVVLDPSLAEAHFALARTSGAGSALGHVIAGLTARLSTLKGRHDFESYLGTVGLAVLLLVLAVFSVTLLLRHGSLLRHDIEERLGVSRALGIYVLVLLLPTVALQGYGLLPLWWIALMAVYGTKVDRVISAALVLLLVIGVALLSSARTGLLARQSPLLAAGLAAVSGEPGSPEIEQLEKVAAESEDHDLDYLLALAFRKAGRYDEAAAAYERMLVENPSDPVALNNLANIEFDRGHFSSAIQRYRQAAEVGGPDTFRATYLYNLSVALLQTFSYGPAGEARSSADSISGRTTAAYDTTWKYRSGDTAVPTVVDVGPTEEEVWAKLEKAAAGPAAGSAAKAFLAGLGSRFSAAAAIFGLAALVLSRWRGSRSFTLRCLKCGAPFCRRCQLGGAGTGLCTQCHHIYVVRDGVSGPARAQKLQEVKREEGRRQRVFRLLSLLAPGSGHLYAQKPAMGLPLLGLWATTLAALVLAARLAPLTEAAAATARGWVLGLSLLVLATVYAIANVVTPSFESVVSLPRRMVRRARP